MKLQRRYTTIVTSLVSVIILVLSVAQFFQFSTIANEMTRTSVETMGGYLEKEIQERGLSSARFLSVHIGNALYSYNMEKMEDVISRTKQLPNVKQAYVYDSSLLIVHDGSDTIENYGRNVVSTLNTPNQWRASDSGYQVHENNLISYHPIYFDKDLIGGVSIVLSMNEVQESVASMRSSLFEKASLGRISTAYMVVITASALIILSFLGTYFVAKSLVGPIKKLHRFADQIGEGDYGETIRLDRDDELGELALAFKDMSDKLKTKNSEMKYIAYHDELTGLSNRRLFREHLERELKRLKRSPYALALLYIDLDDFKKINDTLGHDVGDLLLKEAGNRIVETIRGADCAGVNVAEGDELAARIGGDEFMVLLTSISKVDNVAIICERIIEKVSLPYLINGNKFVIGASIGVTVAPVDGVNAEILIKNADLAMYQSKGKGKNQYQFYSEALNIAVMKKFSIESDLKTAISSEQFSLLYQPKLKSDTGEIVGAEALIRWFHPQKGWVPPDKFIPIAEESGAILPIGQWVIEESCRQLAAWRNEGVDAFPIAINVSSVQFQSQNVPELIQKNLKKYDLESNKLQVEVTETALISSEKSTIEQLNELEKMGVYLWLDDFGTGYSSLSYLRKLPINGIKIDRSFIMEFEKNDSDRDIVAAMIVLAKTLKLDVIAEGVETKYQLDTLIEKGCCLAQGYYFYKPLPAKEFALALSKVSPHSSEPSVVN